MASKIVASRKILQKNMLNESGPKIKPRGTPIIIPSQVLQNPPVFVTCFQFWRLFYIKYVWLEKINRMRITPQQQNHHKCKKVP